MKSRIILFITAVWLGCLSSALALVQYPMTVANIAELQALSVPWVQSAESALVTPTNVAVYVLGYYNPGDRGGGMFEWDPNSSGTPDGGRYITTNGWSTGNGRWIRMLNGETANVKMWGATGNGVTDDTISIQNAVNSFLDTWTEEMLFPSGQYSLTNTIVFPGFCHLRGEGDINSSSIFMHGEHDVFRTVTAQTALTGGAVGDDPGVIFENMNIFMDTNATSNAGLVLCHANDGNTIRNILIDNGGYGIRVFGGAPGLQLSHVGVFNSYVAGVSIEGFLPNGTAVGGGGSAISIQSLCGDHHRPDSDATASLVRFYRCVAECSVYDFKAEGSFGGGLFNYYRSFGATNVDGMNGTLTISGGSYNCGYSNCDFVVLSSEGGYGTPSVLINPVSISGIRHLIRDDLTGRTIDPALYDSGNSGGLNQSFCRLPAQYESWATHSRYVVGHTDLAAFVPTITNAWYRVMEGGYHVGGRLIINGWQQSSDISVDINVNAGSDGPLINVIRATKSTPCCTPACVTQVRAGTYYDPSLFGNRPFVDVYVDHTAGFGDPGLDKIMVAYPIESDDMYGEVGTLPLVAPTSALSSIVPAGCTLVNCVTNSLIR